MHHPETEFRGKPLSPWEERLMKLTLKRCKPLFGSVLKRPEELKSAQELADLKLLCTITRNFSNTALRKAISRVPKAQETTIRSFCLSWIKLKVLDKYFPHLRDVIYIMLRNMWDIQFQLEYLDLLEGLPQSSNYYFFGIVKESLYRNKPDFRTIAEIYVKTPLKEWITEKVFPRIYYRKESKLEYSFMKNEFSKGKLDVFRQRVKALLAHINLEKIFVPPPDCVFGADLRLYNDGGVPRKDWERPQTSTTCGFLLQVFNPKPLGTREVWLPDYATKVSNSFWMTIGRQLLSNCRWFPSDDPEETYMRIKARLTESFFGYFDISAFGLQYPRELLCILTEEIGLHYPNPDMSEQVKILLGLLQRKFPLQTSGTTFVYPTRGIGLGYFEDLKTLGIMAILMPWQESVISLYGDQGLISLFRKNFKYLKTIIQELRDFNFIIKDDKVDTKTGVVKWSGWTMGASTKVDRFEKRCHMTSTLMSILDGRYHWERKLRLRSFYGLFPEYQDRFRRFGFLYETIYGYEFRPGDSLNSILQCGASPHSRMELGTTRWFRVQQLVSPKDQITDNLIFSTPLFMEWKEADAARFDKNRRSCYRTTRGTSYNFEYCNPQIVPYKSIRPKLSHIMRATSDRTEMRLIAFHGLSTGKFTYGTDKSYWDGILKRHSLAPNPFESFVTGGYSVATSWHHPRRVSAEWLFVVQHLKNHIDDLDTYMTRLYSDNQREFDRVKNSYESLNKRVPFPSWGNPPPPKRIRDSLGKSYTISLDKINVVRPSQEEGPTSIVASTILNDFQSRIRIERSLSPDLEPGEEEDLVDIDGVLSTKI
jgi:hypothetical protein